MGWFDDLAKNFADDFRLSEEEPDATSVRSA